jgi:hypothetical protein
MTPGLAKLFTEHEMVSRRWLLRAGALGAAALGTWTLDAAERTPELEAAIADLETYMTLQDDFQDVSRGKPKPHSLPDETKRKVGLTRDTWKLNVTSDPDHPARLRAPMSAEKGNALTFAALMEIASQHAVRFPKVMTCLNIGCPLGMGIWEGVPLREVLWLTQPTENLRRVFFYGYHNDDPKQMFRSSLPVGRVLEDPFELPPVILCYKLNGEWLNSERGGPVRIVVPEAYGFKSIKWLSNLVLSNIWHANDTYGTQNNDVDSPLKSFAATLGVPRQLKPNSPFAVTGYAQVGISGLSKVQVWIQPEDEKWDRDDRYFSKAPWVDAEILPPPTKWGGGLSLDSIPPATHGFNETGQPHRWPMRLAKVHWAVMLPGLRAGKYVLRSRTIDEKGHPQPLPRPFRKSGHSAIERMPITVEA